MKNFAVKAWMLVIVSALSVAGAACGGDDSDDEPTTPAATSAVTTAAQPTERPSTATPPADAAESYSDFDEQTQASINRLCTWSASAAAGDLPADPFADLDPTVANPLRAGQLGQTLGQHGEAFADAAESRDPAELAAVGTDLSAACESIGWTPS